MRPPAGSTPDQGNVHRRGDDVDNGCVPVRVGVRVGSRAGKLVGVDLAGVDAPAVPAAVAGEGVRAADQAQHGVGDIGQQAGGVFLHALDDFPAHPGLNRDGQLDLAEASPAALQGVDGAASADSRGEGYVDMDDLVHHRHHGAAVRLVPGRLIHLDVVLARRGEEGKVAIAANDLGVDLAAVEVGRPGHPPAPAGEENHAGDAGAGDYMLDWVQRVKALG